MKHISSNLPIILYWKDLKTILPTIFQYYATIENNTKTFITVGTTLLFRRYSFLPIIYISFFKLLLDAEEAAKFPFFLTIKN
ncbi:MAG: hypothetical protein JNM21_03020 [Taibaiella sp.]|nr:hypothetical protein [Taibaiella sp.]